MLICAVDKQTLRTGYIGAKTDKNESRICGEKEENVWNVVCECTQGIEMYR